MKTAITKLSWVLAVSGIVIFLISTPVLAKKECPELVWEGDYYIRNIEDIEALAGYTKVTGYLYIGGHNLINLNELRTFNFRSFCGYQ